MAETDIDRYYSEIMTRMSPQQLQEIESRGRPEPAFQPMPETLAESNLLKRTPSIKFPIADTYRNNIVQAASDREDALMNMRQKQTDLQGRADADMSTARQALTGFNAPSAQYKPNEEIELGLKEARSGSQVQAPTERDLLSEVILSFGPAVLGGMTGESGQIAQLESGKNARSMFEARRKEAIDSAKAAREAAQKRYTDLMTLKQKDRENFDKTQERELKKLETIVKTNVDFAKMTNDQLNKIADEYNKADDSSLKAREDAAYKLSELEMVPGQEKAKEERARILANMQQQKMNMPTQSERDAAGYAGMAAKAEAELDQLGGPDGMNLPSLKDPGFTIKANIMSGETPGSSLLENAIRDPRVRAQLQAEIDWAMTTLRDESGAAIGKSEAVKQLNRYFPRSGDDAAAVAQKKASRLQKAAALKSSAGRAEIPAVQAPQPSAPKGVPGLNKKKLGEMTYEQKLKLAREKGLL